MNPLVLAMTAAMLLFVSCCSADKRPDPAANKTQANQTQPSPPKPCVNLNTATEQELMTLAGIGQVMARKIIEYREQNGPFRRPQDIIIIDGFSEQKYRAISEQICAN